jgi:hypothetical protein
MFFPFLVLPDGTKVVYSDIQKKDGKEYVLVKFKRWNDERNDFDRMECLLPNGQMTKIVGFTADEAANQEGHMHSLQDMILECSREDSED